MCLEIPWGNQTRAWLDEGRGSWISRKFLPFTQEKNGDLLKGSVWLLVPVVNLFSIHSETQDFKHGEKNFTPQFSGYT